jgi:hypothetical protein
MRSKPSLIEMQMLYQGYPRSCIEISDIEMVNKKNYGTIGYRMKTSIYRTIGYRTNENLAAAQLYCYFRNILTLGYLCAHLNYIKKLKVYGGEIKSTLTFTEN